AFGTVGPSDEELDPSVVANDKVAGVQAVVTGANPNAQLKADSWTKVSGPGPANALTFDYGTGQVTVPVGTPHGDYKYSYELCTKPGVLPKKCDPAEVTLKVVVVDAVDNDFGEVSAATTLATSIYANDTVNGAAVDASNAALKSGSWSLVAAPAGGSLTLNDATGAVTVPAGAPAGDYIYSYEICAQPGGKPCDTAQVKLKVKSPAPAAPVVKAVDNAFGEVAAGSSTASVFANDTVDGAAAVLTGPGKNAELKAGSWQAGAGNPAGGTLTLNADGTVAVPADAPAGDYTYSYEICAHPAGKPCDTATVTLKVKPAPILAVDNHLGTIAAGSSNTVSIFANDLINGVAMQPGVNAALKRASWKKLSGPAGGDLSLKDDGTVLVPPGTPAGAYEYSYEICVLPGGAPCAVAKVTLTVTAAGLVGPGVTPVPVGAPWALLLAALGIVGLGRRFTGRKSA
ncbi:MAG: hypothetical protein Q4A97_11925, partial [Comamonadaceae bacterium]|nr:hypothetical protein [Comamonadaceae bacterium]